jgi:hypothetical protein
MAASSLSSQQKLGCRITTGYTAHRYEARNHQLIGHLSNNFSSPARNEEHFGNNREKE